MKDVDILHVHFVTVEVGIVGRSARYWGPCCGSLGGMLTVSNTIECVLVFAVRCHGSLSGMLAVSNTSECMVVFAVRGFNRKANQER